MRPWHHLPSLRTLRVFECAARHLNWSRAAAELHLTHGAISVQIKALEEDLDTKLFVRDGRRTALTEAGQQLAIGVREALDQLALTVSRVRERSAGHVLTLSVLPSFAAAWLVGRLGGFLARHADIELNLQSSTGLADFRNDGVDVAIRWGNGAWPDLHCDKLLDDELFPVLSPNLATPPLEHPVQLLDLPLVRVKQQARLNDWVRWFAAAGVTVMEPRRGPVFDDTELALRAAAQGHGVVLGRSSLVAARLASGELIAPFALRIPSFYAYYLVCPQTHLDKPSVRKFRAWLIEELAHSSPLAPPPEASA
ncbi:transcriptional regulator GcvA [Tahibacter amnicola]|uniref:Transcriptional regulator GcvA n=1 Tax=Tahibacter amnicola TaxID=2976241 RepID=A0ABY6BCC0_9GAMM|nr:transcriptional regulator GcvA [Tahibacter amnicola]UXI67442.1 transcriptional regulator GcvA [Tahibacter amnicola]